MSMDVQTSMRLPTTLLDRADELVDALRDDPTLAMMGKMTRSKVLRLALNEGLAILERRQEIPRAQSLSTFRTRARALVDPAPSDPVSTAQVSHTYTRVPAATVSMEED